MLQTVQKKIKELNMINAGDKVLAGVSGGADSVCLLLVLAALQKEINFGLEVMHVEHGIRGEESIKDAGFVADVCKKVGVVCHTRSVDVPAYCRETGLGTEEAARILRYHQFNGLAKELGAKVAVAHNLEDNAETILFQLARGSSLTGLCGIRPIRTNENGITYIRPLLSVHRKEIEDFLQTHGMGYRVDSTNEQLDYSRNYIRKVILPELQKVNSQVVEHINGTATQLFEVKDFLEMETEKAWACVIEHADGIKVNIPELLECHKAVQKEVIYKAIAATSGGKKDITAVHVEDILSLCNNQSGKMIMLPNGVQGKREYESLYIGKQQELPDIDMESQFKQREWIVAEADLETLVLNGEKEEISFGDGGEKLYLSVFMKEENKAEIPQKTYTKWFDYDKIKKGFCIRTRKSGDYLISDVLGHRKKLKQYFIDEKIPAIDRECTWLLAQENLVFWVVGGRISEHVKITEDTKTILEITYDGGKERE